MTPNNGSLISSEHLPIHTGRVEMKYAVTEAVAAHVLQWSRVFLRSDRGLAAPQLVTSLYLDTPTLRFFRWHLEGSSDRFKLRVRGYGERPHDCLYAEIKRKTGVIVRKQRAEIPVTALPAVLGSDSKAYREFAAGNSDALQAFLNVKIAFQAQPGMLVSCLREALRENSAAGELAVTVDRRIRCQPSCREDLVDDADAWTAVYLPNRTVPATAIVELKYTHCPPRWMATLIARLAPHRVNFSKYKAAMQQRAAQWSTCHVQPIRPEFDVACSGTRTVIPAISDDRVGLYAY